MPIYLVRWPDLSASLVRARDEEDLVDVLDQVANPDGCEWSVYEGPLFVDFRLPAKWDRGAEPLDTPPSPEQIVVGDLGRMPAEGVLGSMELSLADCDEGHDTGMEILRGAFPAVSAAMDKLSAADEALEDDGVLPEADLRRTHLLGKTDSISELARQMDMPVSLVRKLAELARRRAIAEEESPDSPTND
jgi:hypothetical protein